jgi:hypothetical protein
LKIYGEGEWLDQQRGVRSPRRWRKLHLGVDAGTHEIVAVELTPDDVGDVSELPGLLDQIDAEVASLTADGAYDGNAVYDAVADRHSGADVIIPPRATAVLSEITTTQRDRHITTIEKHGRMGWQPILAIIVGAWLKLRFIGTRPSLTDDFEPGLCRINGLRQGSDATCSI